MVISTVNDVIRIKNLNTIKEKIKFENATNKTFLFFSLNIATKCFNSVGFI